MSEHKTMYSTGQPKTESYIENAETKAYAAR